MYPGDSAYEFTGSHDFSYEKEDGLSEAEQEELKKAWTGRMCS